MSYTKIEISKMSVSDFNLIKDSLVDDFDNYWKASTFETEIKAENSYYVVAKEIIDDCFENNFNLTSNDSYQNNAEIVGFAGMKIVIDEADIMNIVTKKNKRNLGIASLMLDKLIYIAKEKNIKKLTLEVNNRNLLAIHLYKKFGFKEIAVRKKYYNNTDDAIIMQTKI